MTNTIITGAFALITAGIGAMFLLIAQQAQGAKRVLLGVLFFGLMALVLILVLLPGPLPHVLCNGPC